HFDNSPNNPNNPDPNAEVKPGDQTFDEMMAVFTHMAVPVGSDPAKLIRRPPPPADYAKPPARPGE
ncbi:MAG: hypothetical protein ACRD8O_13280, partial [Bryobacteraceae bacterium]